MIFSESFGTASFNISVEDREPCLRALNDGKDFDPEGYGESVKNLYARYQDICDLFPEEIGRQSAAVLRRLADREGLLHRDRHRDRTGCSQGVRLHERSGAELDIGRDAQGLFVSEAADDKQREILNGAWKGQDARPQGAPARARRRIASKRGCVRSTPTASARTGRVQSRRTLITSAAVSTSGCATSTPASGLTHQRTSQFIEEFCKFADATSTLSIVR